MAERHPQHLAERVAEAISRRGLIGGGDTVVVGLSGGPDSVALLHVLRQLRDDAGAAGAAGGFDLRACHLHHGLRGDDADEDERLCVSLCRELDVELTLDRERRFRLPPAVEGSGTSDGGGTDGARETEARGARYAFYKDVVASVSGPARLALAHHLDDQTETLVHRILRGTGLHGLRGIPWRRPLDAGGAEVIRPLLAESRDAILAFLKGGDIAYRCDSTNALPATARNRIRNELLPWVRRELGLEPHRTLPRLGQLADEAQEFIDRHARLALRAASIQENPATLALDRLGRLDVAVLRRVLGLAVQSVGGSSPEYEESERLLALLRRDGPRAAQLRHGITVSRRNDALHFEHRRGDGCAGSGTDSPASRPGDVERELTAPGPNDAPEFGYRFTLDTDEATSGVEWTQLEPTLRRDPTLECFDLDEVRLPLRVRAVRAGDRIALEDGGHAKLQDLLVDRRVPRSRRDSIPVLVDADDRVIWVVGVRRTGIARLRASTRRYLTVKAEPA